MEITREQFIEEIKALKETTTINASSLKVGNIGFTFNGCLIYVRVEDGIDGEITIFKPGTDMEVTFDFAIIGEIIKKDSKYTISFSNGLPDMDVEIVTE